ncbi:MAG TPA: hypothetical protein VMW18_18415 [Candidatus Binatia bacterium]|nr:hypothetical protein [Candidatus Binatia bacterium]
MDFNAMLQSVLSWFQHVADQTGLWLSGVFAWLGGIFDSWRAQPNVAISSAIAALAVVIALASFSQTRLVRKRLENVKSDFFAAFRPKFIVRDVYAPHFNPGEPIEVRYTVCNVGGSPAKIVESSIAVEVLRASGLALVPQCNGRNPVGEIVLNPGEAHSLGFRSAEVTWEKNFIRAGSANAPKLVFAGQLGYEDARGVRRRTSFCRSFDVKRERFYPMGDPELEYAD